MVIVAQNNYGVHRAEYNIDIKSVCNLLDVEQVALVQLA